MQFHVPAAARPSIHRWLVSLCCCLLLAALAPTAGAATKAAHPDFGGFWFIARGAKIERMSELTSKLAPNTVWMTGAGGREPGKGDFGGLKVKPAARELALKADPFEAQSISNVCKPPSIVYAMPGPFPIEIYPATELMVFKLEYYDLVRIVFMDGRAHPGPDYPHSKVGHSVGHWEGDTLVVDTTHLAAAAINDNGLNHTDNVHVIERLRLSADRKFLHVTQEFDDPEILDNRGARYFVLEKQQGEVMPYECDPAYGVSIEKRER